MANPLHDLTVIYFEANVYIHDGYYLIDNLRLSTPRADFEGKIITIFNAVGAVEFWLTFPEYNSKFLILLDTVPNFDFDIREALIEAMEELQEND